MSPRFFLLSLVATTVSAFTFSCLFVAFALANPRSNLCCEPAHPATPTEPPFGELDCVYKAPQKSCQNQTGYCSGDAWQNAVKGKCVTASADKSCSDNAATTTVTIKKGVWYCHTNADTTCDCKWAAYEPTQTKDESGVANCTGSPCP